MKLEELLAKYPKIFPNPIGISAGWVHLFDKPLEYINGQMEANVPYCPQLTIISTKEKFGSLRIHYQWVIPEGKVWDNYKLQEWYINGYIGVIRYIEYLSNFTCENTGEAGSLWQKNGWMKTYSKTEAKRLGFEKLPERIKKL